MAHHRHPHPYTEEYQQAAYNGFPFLPEFGHRRPAPREEPYIHYRPAHQRGGPGWYQGGRKQPPSFRSQKFWARPVDATRRGAWGRIRDGLTGRGGDVFVVANGDRRTLMRDVPGRTRWGNWDSTGLRWCGEAEGRGEVEDMDWYPRGEWGDVRWARRERDEVYNFRTRRYEDITGRNKGRFWSDAHWGPKGRKSGGGFGGRRGAPDLPTCWRGWDGMWYSRVDGSAGRWPGGRPLR